MTSTLDQLLPTTKGLHTEGATQYEQHEDANADDYNQDHSQILIFVLVTPIYFIHSEAALEIEQGIWNGLGDVCCGTRDKIRLEC